MSHLWRKLVRFGFRLLYNELAWTYDIVSWLVSLGEWRAWQLAALPYVQGPHVLEIGHGPGHMLRALEAAGYEVVGLDLSAFMGRMAQKRLQREDLPARLVRAKVQALPLATAVFDTILSTFPTEYIVDPVMLAEAKRVLKPDGGLVIVPEGHLTSGGWSRRVIGWLFRITSQREGAFATRNREAWPAPDAWDVFRQRFAAAGFSLQVHTATRARSAATVLVAISSS